MCDCIQTIHDKFPEHSVNATMAFRTGEVSRPMIDLLRKDNWKRESRRNKPGFIVASYCPWCGEKYPEHPGADQQDVAA